MCLGYMSNVIEDYFKDGSDFGANIKYIVEERRMGTAGALSLIKEKIDTKTGDVINKCQNSILSVSTNSVIKPNSKVESASQITKSVFLFTRSATTPPNGAVIGNTTIATTTMIDNEKAEFVRLKTTILRNNICIAIPKKKAKLPPKNTVNSGS